MTIQQRTFIELEDIAGIEYTCKHCGAEYLVPIGHLDRVINQCPNCKEGLIKAALLTDEAPTEETFLKNFVRALIVLRDSKLGIKLELSVALDREASGRA
jgi:hypothetical protein